MSDRMLPIPFEALITRLFEEYRKYGTVYGVHKKYTAPAGRTLSLFGEKMETPFGPAAGPNTQLAQNIIAAYFAGCRFFELKTVQKLDGEDLPVSKPCILAEDECYNCEWSTELTVPQAFDEYVKAWWACKLMAIELGLGSPDGFIFNMSVGYDLEGIKLPKLDKFIEGLKDASDSPIWKECRDYVLAHISDFKKVTASDVEGFSPRVCTSATLSTLHGCPSEDIEKIASYLLTEKHVNTFIKCNPTLLGYDYARATLDEMGYDYIQFGRFHFEDDMQYELAVPMLQRLQAIADRENLEFGVKITNTFPVDVKRNELPSEEMYMSGKSLYPLSLSVAMKLSKDFAGKLRISYSGGADAFNITKLYKAGIWPITFATTILKPGGYNRVLQIADEFEKQEYGAFKGVDADAVTRLVEEAKKDPHHTKPVKIAPSRKSKKEVPITDCFIAPCSEGCPIHQDITAYMKLVEAGRYLDAMKVIGLKNAVPNITGTICAHPCMGKCTRNFYESPVTIRAKKLIAAQKAGVDYEKYLGEKKLHSITSNGIKVAVVGAGPAGIAAANQLSRAGFEVTVYDKRNSGGGTVAHVITEQRIGRDAIAQDISYATALGARFVFDHEITALDELRSAGYKYVIIAVGAGKPGILKISGCEPMNAISFLERVNLHNQTLNIGRNVAVVGGGNTAMDTARAAKAFPGVENVYLVYRRDKRNMPADAEELELAVNEGVEFKDLLSPIGYSDGRLICKKNILGEYDKSGRRTPVETEEIVTIPVDTVIAAVGEKVDSELYKALELELNEKGLPICDKYNQSSVDSVYVAGDGLNGPSTIVQAVADATTAVEHIIKRSGIDLSSNPVISEARALIAEMYDASSEKALIAKKGILAETEEALCAELKSEGFDASASKCLGCDKICENCVDVCPNRANIAIEVPGMKMPQIVHIDRMCNECGNCTIFCPYASLPYKDKLTLYNDLNSFNNSTNQGFLLLDDTLKTFRVRLWGVITDEEPFTEHCSLGGEIRDIIKAVYTDYHYLL